jgi:hypothetical protein
MKILIVYKNPQTDSPLVYHQGLGVTGDYLSEGLNNLGINTTCLSVKNGEDLWTKLNDECKSYTHVVMCAPFIDAGFLQKLFKNFPDKKFVITYHSNLGFLTTDRFAVSSLELYFNLEKACPNFTISTNCLELSKSIESATNKKFTYLPNLFPVNNKKPKPNYNYNPRLDAINIGIFGAMRILKNWLTAGVSAMIIANYYNTKVNLYISSGREENAGSTKENIKSLIALNSKVTLHETGWRNHKEFLELLKFMDLLLQPSFSETFNNVTAEGITNGVPSVVSDAIVWAPDSWKARSDSATDIAKTGIRLLNNNKSFLTGYSTLEKYVKNSSKIWLKWLGK